MKNVLFATTALVAMTGTAFAASHGGGATVAFDGEVTAGYNDVIEGGIFWDAEVNVTATVDMGGNVVATLTAGLVSGDETGATVEFTPTIEIAYTGSPFNASLKVGDLGDKGASEYWYADRDGMTTDVENHDGTTDARALVEFGNFGVAVGCSLGGDGACDGMNVGAGATFGSISIGIGYDDGANGDSQVTAVSADAAFGAMTVGISFATSPDNFEEIKSGVDGDDTDADVGGTDTTYFYANDSIGVEVGYTLGSVELEAYYATNSFVGDAFGVSAAFTAGAIAVTAYYDNTVAIDHAFGGVDLDEDGYFTGGETGTGGSSTTTVFGADASYAVSGALSLLAGVAISETTGFVPVASATDYYVGIEYTVNSNVSATVSYATADELSGPEFKDGITALITASF